MWMIAQFLRDGKREWKCLRKEGGRTEIPAVTGSPAAVILWKQTKNENILLFKLLKFHKKVIINL